MILKIEISMIINILITRPFVLTTFIAGLLGEANILCDQHPQLGIQKENLKRLS